MGRHNFKYQHKDISQYLIPNIGQPSLTLARYTSEIGWVKFQQDTEALTALFPAISVLACRHTLFSRRNQKLYANFIIVLVH